MKRPIAFILGISLIFLPLFGDLGTDKVNEPGAYVPELSAMYTISPTIRIDSNADFGSQGWPGSGTILDPWMIEGIEIDGTGQGFGIYIGNTSDVFTIKDSYFHDATGGPVDQFYNNSAVILYNVLNGHVNNNIITNSTHGIRLFSSMNNTLSNNEVDNNAYGILLEGQFGFHLLYEYHGENINDNLGRFVDSAGDVDNDGHDDIIMGAPGFSTATGKAYVISGKNGTYLYNYTGDASGDEFGTNVVGLWDLNNDDHDDYLVSAPYNDDTGSDAGKAIVYSGLDGTVLYTKWGEAADDTFGGSIDKAGDVNNDGYGDFIIGAENNDNGGSASQNWGKAYLYSGLDGSELYSNIGGSLRDYYGCSVGYAGDVNNDGFSDFTVGAWGWDGPGSNRGTAYVYSGQTYTQLWQINGEKDLDNMGRSPSSIGWAGDLDNDGFSDFIVGSPRWEPTGTSSDNHGRAYTFSGQTGLNIFTYDGEAVGDRLGRRVHGLGDVDQDGTDDFVIGAPWNSANNGRVYVYSGASGVEIFRISGSGAEELGAPRNAGDINADGIPDLVLGAPMNVDTGSGSGAVYVYTTLATGSRNNTIEANNISQSTNFGLWSKSNSTMNMIFHNNFIANGQHALDDGQNTWNDTYPFGGNYWDDYAGVDVNSGPLQDTPPSDDIGDTPLPIPGTGGNTDHYPLMLPFSQAEVEFNISLGLGWNLISVPLVLDSYSLDDALSSIAGKWDLMYVYQPGNTDPWISNNTMRPDNFNDLDTLDMKNGFWINVTEVGQTLNLIGSPAQSTTIPLKAGWNLVGYPSMTEKALSDALSGTGYTRVEGFNSSLPYNVGQLQDTYMMGPGEAYWVKVSVDVDWIVDW